MRLAEQAMLFHSVRQHRVVQTEGPIIAVAISGDERYLVTVGENKMLSLWQLPGLELINERWVFWLVVLLLLIFSLSLSLSCQGNCQRDRLSWHSQKTHGRSLYPTNLVMFSGIVLSLGQGFFF